MTRREALSMHPGEAFGKAMELGDIESARFVLPRIKKYLPESQYIRALAALAETSDEASKNELLAMIARLVEKKSYQELKVALVGLTDFYFNTAAAAQGISELKDTIYQIANDESLPNDIRAFTLNRLQMLRYQEGAFVEALIDAMKVVELAPTDDSYHYNLSLIYERLERYSEAANSALKFLEYADEVKPNHLEHVKEVFTEAGRLQELEGILNKLLA